MLKVLCREPHQTILDRSDSEVFDKEYDARTFSEQGFSIGKESLNLDSLKHKGRVGYIAFSMYMYGNVTGSKDSCRGRKTRSDAMCEMFPRMIFCYA